MERGLGPHILIIPASLSLQSMGGAAIGRAPTISQNDSFYTRIYNFAQCPILSATSVAGAKHKLDLTKLRQHTSIHCNKLLYTATQCNAFPGLLTQKAHAAGGREKFALLKPGMNIHEHIFEFLKRKVGNLPSAIAEMGYNLLEACNRCVAVCCSVLQ